MCHPIRQRGPTTSRSTRSSPRWSKLGRAYADADHLRRNVRTIDVLIDEQTILSGAAAGAPWKYFDLGHGMCANPFYKQCPHRMARARCSFYRPKPSTLEANAEGATRLRQITRMQQALTLTEDEVAAVTEGAELLQSLVDRLKDVPRPSGQTPRQIEIAKAPVLDKDSA
jgi:hypothetical protein